MILEDDRKFQTWHVSEKLHGGNFSIIFDGKTIKHCRRTDVLQPDENFYNYKEDLAFAVPKVKEIFNLISSKFVLTLVNYIQVYGEYFGPKIQKGINYGDKRDWYIFDIKINGSYYLNFSFVQELCKEVGLTMPPFIFSGTLDECLKCSNEFDSKILGIEDNVCEGIVIRPEETFYIGTTRVIIKNKNAKWEEKAKVKRKIKPQEKHVITEEELEFLSYINENRINSVISKDPKVAENFGSLMSATIKDAMEEFPCKISKYLNKNIAEIIRPVFLEKMNDNFKA
jgi:Rnl2 family RNA ligase